MSMLQMMMDNTELPKSAVLFFWDVIESFGEDNERHVAASDSPPTGGWDDSSTHAQIVCTQERVDWDEYGKRTRRNASIGEQLETVTCEACRVFIENCLMFSGIWED